MTVFLLAAVCVGTAGAEETNERYFAVSSLAELNETIGYANAVGNSSYHYKIVIVDDIPISGSDSITAITGDVTLTTTNSENHMIYRTGANTSTDTDTDTGMLTVGNGGNLTIRNNDTFVLTLYGNKSHVTGNLQSLVYVNKGNFTMYGGNLTGNEVLNPKAHSNVGGGLHIANGNFTMYKGDITHNDVNREPQNKGGGVYAENSNVTIKGGNICYNTAAQGGGIFMIRKYFTLDGGNISHNDALYNGGGVYLSSSDTTGNMISGNVTKNIAGQNGAGINIYQGIFTMNGGSVSYNQGSTIYKAYGGGIAILSGASLDVSGDAKISGNSATYGGGVSVSGVNSDFSMSGGEINDNTADTGNSVAVADGGTVEISGADTKIISEDGTGIYSTGGGVFVSPADWQYAQNPVITTASLPDGEVDKSYTPSFSALVTSIVNWTVSGGSLPDGLILAENGKITGTPTKGGKYTFTVRVVNKKSDSDEEVGIPDTKSFTIIIYETVTPKLPIDEPVKETNGNTTITNTTSGVMNIQNGNVTIIGDSSNDNVTMTVTFNETLTDMDDTDALMTVSGNVTNVQVNYKESYAQSSTVIDGVKYRLSLTLINVTRDLPTINPMFNTTVNNLIKKEDGGKYYTTLATISATADDIDKINSNITENGIELVFKIPKSYKLNTIKAFHIDGNNVPTLIDDGNVTIGSDATNYLITVKGSTFSTYAIVNDGYIAPAETPTPSSSSSQGSSIWLTETPTPTPTATPTPSDAVPTDIPDVKPTQTPDSPSPILGILAGLSVAVAILRRR